MNKTTLEFIRPGLQTLVQDLGRTIQRESGVPAGGALDKSSAVISNKLVGNDIGAPVLEVTVAGPTIRFIGDECHIAITGADISPEIDGNKIELYRSIRVAPNSVLTFGKLTSGCRAYIAIKGEWQVRKWLHSASAIFPELPDITPDSFISKGSKLEIIHSGISGRLIYPHSLRPVLKESQIIRLFLGPEIGMFSKEARDKFFSLDHFILPASNRWGYRLDSHIPLRNPGQEIISSGVIPGTIQVPHSGEPIILMADAQTTGGYPRIAVVINEDMDKLAQAKPGDRLCFSLVEGG